MKNLLRNRIFVVMLGLAMFEIPPLVQTATAQATQKIQKKKYQVQLLTSQVFQYLE